MFPAISVSINGMMIFDAIRQASKKPAILVPPQFIKWTWFNSNASNASVSSSELFELFEKCLSTFLRFSYKTWTSNWHIVFEVQRRLMVPKDACDEQRVNDDLMPYISSNSLDPFILTPQPSPHTLVGILLGSFSRWISFVSLEIPLSFDILK